MNQAGIMESIDSIMSQQKEMTILLNKLPLAMNPAPSELRYPQNIELNCQTKKQLHIKL